MKVKVLILLLFFGLAGGTIAAKVFESKQKIDRNYLPQYSYSWADFARMMEVYR
ncbi:hypothetical protein [Synechococcus sp. PCC 7502]|uniref:hypothetical protein n=1 Tax=Synechococcus sp. PCC 7502 TaxID=1173263 RepID=UPI0002F74AF6|nr:hypothetical protein [Synechococcus sp. PCC 7502]